MGIKVGQGSTHKVLVAIPKEMVAELDAVASNEYRGRSDLIREALRRYLEVHKEKAFRLSSVPENVRMTD